MRVAPNDCVEAFKRQTGGLFGWENESLFWLSPTADNEYAEYYEEESLERLGLVDLEVPLRDFSPRSGPPCDSLTRTKSGGVILVEAKAYLEDAVHYTNEAGETSLAESGRPLNTPACVATKMPSRDPGSPQAVFVRFLL